MVRIKKQPPISSKTPSAFFTVSEVAEILRISEKTVRRWIAAGKIISHQAGRRHLIPRTYLEAIFEIARPGVDRQLVSISLKEPESARKDLENRTKSLEKHVCVWQEKIKSLPQVVAEVYPVRGSLTERLQNTIQEMDSLRADGVKLLRRLKAAGVAPILTSPDISAQTSYRD